MSSTINKLEQKALEISAQVDWMAEQVNDFQMIRQYMTNRVNEFTLSPMQEFKLKRYQFIYDQLSSGKYSDKEVREMTMKMFNIAENQAMSDMKTSQELFSTTLSVNKKFKILLQIQHLEKMQRKARDNNKLDEYSKLQRVMNELLRMLPDEIETPTDNFEPRKNVIMYDPSILGVQKVPDAEIKDLLAKISRELGHNAIDVDFTLLEDDRTKNTPQ
jgi:hypothetical protein